MSICRKCVYYFTTESPEKGNCWRYPPTLIFGKHDGKTGVGTYRPMVDFDDTCGEFKQRKAKRKAL